jgi:hypothetical protein
LNISNRCNQIVSAGNCFGSIVFHYDRGEYDVSLQASSSSIIGSTDNKRYVMLHISLYSSFFSYDIERACQNKDDCARDLITNVAVEMFPRQYNYSAIMNEVRPLISGPPLTPEKPNLNCYDSNQCGTSTKPGACVIEDTILKKEISIRCDNQSIFGDVYISIYHSDRNFATFGVHCNRSVCNSPSTLQSAKELMFKYNITATLDGRLMDLGNSDGSKSMMSISLMIMMIFGLLLN